ncbi:MAG: PIN/TRAM domain-containing protein, partial [Bacillus sp. (in: firmicutes)]
MLKRITQACLLIIGGTLGMVLIPKLLMLIGADDINYINNPYVAALLGALIFYLITFWTVDYVIDAIRWTEERLVKVPITDIIFGTIGLVVGLLVAFLLSAAISSIKVPIVNTVLPILITLLFGYLGLQVGTKKRDELMGLFKMSRKKAHEHEQEGNKSKQEQARSLYKILDTSVIIDGRIADICQTGFVEGTIVIPQFVLEELQHIADSSDALKRNRGRRGLDILNRIQKELAVNVEFYEGDFEEIQEVDSKLIKLAKVMHGVLVTNDFNLNKVCEFQNVPVLNINDLANAVKPVVIPGEEMNVLVIKDGKEQNQGV